MPNLTNEEKIFLIASNPALSREVIDFKIGTILQTTDSIDSDQIVSLALKNGTAGLLYKNTRELTFFSKQLTRTLREQYHKTTMRNLQACASTLQLLTKLAKNNIEAIPLKGAHASDVIFEDLGVYPSGDIDVLIKPEHLSDIKNILCANDTYTQAPIDEADLLASHYHLMFYDKDHWLIEIHWNLVKRYVQIPPSFWWLNCETTTWQKRTILQMEIEKYLMYTFFRLFDHGYKPFKFFVLIAAIIDKYSKEINWEKFLGYCKQYKMERLSIFTLKLLNELLDTHISESINARSTVGYQPLRKLVLSGIFSDTNRPHLRMIAYTMLLDSPLDIFHILVGRIFPSKEELCLRYKLHEKPAKVYFYYLLNPILLFLKKKN